MTTTEGPIRGRRWWVLFLLLSVFAGAWSLASPPQSGHDEHSHATRAAGAARGHLLGPEAIDPFPVMYTQMIEVPVPEAYNVPTDCFRGRPEVLPSCAAPFEGSERVVPGYTYQFRSPPWYYVPVGLPTLLDAGLVGYYAMRLLGVVICMALLTSAIGSAATMARPRLGVAAVLVATTPEVVYLIAHVNTNGIEIVAAVCLWATSVALIKSPSAAPARLVTRAGVATAVLVGSRGLSIGFAVGILGATVLFGGVGAARTLARRRDVRAWAAVAAVVAAASLVYIEHVRRWLPVEREGQGVGYALGRLPWYLEQAVGVFGSNEIALPLVVHVAWAAALVGLLVLAVVAGSARAAALSFAVLLVGLAIQVTAEGLALPPIGFFWQGRYALPILVGVPILAVASLERPPPRPTEGGSRDERRLPTPDLGVLLMALVVGGWMVAFLTAVRRYSVGTAGPSAPWRFVLDPGWTPPTGPVALHLACALAAAITSVVLLTRWTTLEPQTTGLAQPSSTSVTS